VGRVERVHIIGREGCSLLLFRHGECLIIEGESDVLKDSADCMSDLFAVRLHDGQSKRGDPRHHVTLGPNSPGNIAQPVHDLIGRREEIAKGKKCQPRQVAAEKDR
jgi:hypothetical protein